jgi:hypothetical protein
MLSGSLMILFLEARHWTHNLRPCSHCEQKGSALQLDWTQDPSGVAKWPGWQRQVWRPAESTPATLFLAASQEVQEVGATAQVAHSGLQALQVRDWSAL